MGSSALLGAEGETALLSGSESCVLVEGQGFVWRW